MKSCNINLCSFFVSPHSASHQLSSTITKFIVSNKKITEGFLLEIEIPVVCFGRGHSRCGSFATLVQFIMGRSQLRFVYTESAADLRGAQGTRAPRPKFLHFHVVFEKNWSSNRLAPPRSWRTPSGKSWIRHC